MSLIPLWQLKALSVNIKKRTDMVVCRVDRKPLAIEGVGEVFMRDIQAIYWKKVKMIITKHG